jgi:hypothetical protein
MTSERYSTSSWIGARIVHSLTCLLARALLIIAAAILIVGCARFTGKLEDPIEKANWPVQCIVEATSYQFVDSVAPSVSDEAIFVETATRRFGFLAVPACKITEVQVPNPPLSFPPLPGIPVDFVPRAGGYGGNVVLQKERNSENGRWWLAQPSEPTATVLSPPPLPPGFDVMPTLSLDGGWVVWVATRSKAIVTSRDGRQEIQVQLPEILRQSLQSELVGIDMIARETVVVDSSNNSSRIIIFGLNAEKHPGPVFPSDIRFEAKTVGHRGRVWIAWDSAQLAWFVDSVPGRYGALKDRIIRSVDVDSEGQLIAVSSVSRAAGVRDYVVVLNARDGSEVFSKYVPAATYSRVAFVGPQFFVYSEGTHTVVLRHR